MKKLRRNFERFCYRNHNKGIPNLMLYICLGAGLVYLIGQFSGSAALYELLCFNRAKILQGQVWRLLSYPLTHGYRFDFFFLLVGLYCYYSLGRAMENIWGTFKFNLFYLSGIVLMDIFAMAFGGTLIVDGNVYHFAGAFYHPEVPLYFDMVYYLHLSMLIGFATMYPNTQFVLFFIIPIRAWIFALIDLGITLYYVLSLTFPQAYFPHNLFPLVALANYFLFFGKDVINVLPLSWRVKAGRKSKPAAKAQPIPFRKTESAQPAPTQKAAYTHCCTVCGRTDVTDPGLEFRYCSRCSGFHCYCQDHISNHTHI